MPELRKFANNVKRGSKYLAFKFFSIEIAKGLSKAFNITKSLYHSIIFTKCQKVSRLPNKEGTSRDKIPAALVGVTGWGRNYLDILGKSDIFELRYCVDIEISKIKLISLPNGCIVLETLDELWKADELQAIFIVTPNQLHYKQSIAAIKHSKHVFIEKPIANTSIEAKNIYMKAKIKKVIISIGHNVRRNHEFRILKEFLEKGEIGDIIFFEANTAQLFDKGKKSWRLNRDHCPCGPLLQLGIHHIDTLRYLFGEIEEVKAFSKKDYFDQIPDTIISILSFKSGLIGYLGTSWMTGPSFTMKVYGTKGFLMIEEDKLYAKIDGIMRQISTKKINTIEEEINEFGESILRGKTPEVDAIEAGKNMIVFEAIMDSLNDHGKSVEIECW